MKKFKKIIRIIGKIILVLLILVILICLICFLVDKYKSRKEMDLLKEAGYVNLVSVGDYRLNVQIYGNENSSHTIVGVSGQGTTDFSVSISGVTEELSKDNKIVIIDRAGYGLSDDTTKTQTIERIVEDYRLALKNSGSEAPYILMAHSLGGVYATYWENKYPEEIEAVIYLDPTDLGDISFILEEEGWEPTLSDIFYATATKIGLTRLYYLFEPLKPWGGIPEEKLEYSKALNFNNSYSYAMYQEAKEAKNNMQKTYDLMTPNNIPKLYISASLNTKEDIIEYFEYINSIYKSFGMEEEIDLNDEEYINELVPKILSVSEEGYNRLTKPYLDKLGNCTYVNIPGYHHIFLQKPNEIIEVSRDFISSL